LGSNGGTNGRAGEGGGGVGLLRIGDVRGCGCLEKKKKKKKKKKVYIYIYNFLSGSVS